ncbi:MAG: hypothetical protein ACP5RP_04405 [Candidatus Micrarchaeia archaeon]
MKLTQVVKVEGDYEILDNLAKITNGLYNSAQPKKAQEKKACSTSQKREKNKNH